ncbi:MAG: MMPL family transporter [Pseudomonadales bacterium]|nr:MMPL family transporter [Pseudomonadales bacterium]
MMLNRYLSWSLNKPKYLLVLASLIIACAIYAGKSVAIENNFAMLFSMDNPDNDYRQFYRDAFGAEDGLLVAIINPEDLTAELMASVESITDKLEASQRFVRVISPSNIPVIRSDEESVYIDPLFGDDDVAHMSLAEKLSYLRQSPNSANKILSTHSNALIIAAEMPLELDSFKKIKPHADFFKTIVSELTQQTDNEIELHFSGIAFTRMAVRDMMIADLALLVPVSMLLMALLIYYIFGSAYCVLITFFSFVFAVTCTKGFMGLCGDNINQITITFPILLLVIVVANNIHFYSRYRSEIADGKSIKDAVSATILFTAKATMISCLTTAVGFFALLSSEMEILRNFGFHLGFGVIFSLLGMLLIIPAMLMLLKPNFKPAKNYRVGSLLNSLVARSISDKNRWRVISVALFLLISCAYISSFANFNYFMSDMLNEEHPQVVAGELMAEHFSGPVPLEISILGADAAFRESQAIKAVTELNLWLEQLGYGKNNLHIGQIVIALNKAVTGENSIPDNRNAIAQLLLLAEESNNGILANVVTEDYSHARIQVNSIDIGASKLIELKQQINQYQQQHLVDSGLQIKLTGETLVVYGGMNKLAEELLLSILTALALILLMVFIVFRQWRLTLAAIFPNVLPIMIGLSIYVISGEGLNPLPGIVFCMAIGVGVDDTIHLYSRYQEERSLGKNQELAIIDAMAHIQGALFSSSVILAAGLLVFMLSSFSWNQDLGWLGATLIIAALLADILLTPAFMSIGAKAESYEPALTDG